MRPNQETISFVVHGAISPCVTRDVLASIRKHFPRSPIILSTWMGQDVSGLEYDALIQSEDPGFYYYSDLPDAKVNNVNRMIVATNGGLRLVETKYAFKIRTDFLLNGDDFLKMWGKFDQADESYQVFQRKVFACCYFSRNPASKLKYPFHPSDLAFFGMTTDLRNLFNVPLMAEKDAYLDGSKYNKYYKHLSNRYVPEQHVFIHCLRNNGRHIECDFFNHCTEDCVEETEKYFASNFVFLTFEQFCLVPLKEAFSLRIHPDAFRTCYTHKEWMELYRKYVNPSMKSHYFDRERFGIEWRYRVFKLKSNLLKAFSRKCVTKMNEIRTRLL